MLHPAPQNYLLAALAAYLPNVRDSLVPDLKRVPLKQDHVLFDAGESPTGANGIPLCAQVRIEGKALEGDSSVLHHALRQNSEACEPIFNRAAEFFGRLALVFTCKRLHSTPQRLANKLLLTREYRNSNPIAITNTSLARSIGGARSVGAQTMLEFRRARWGRSSHCWITVLKRSQIEQIACGCHTFIHHEKNISSVGAPP